jgi:hypothetical protein
MPQQKLNLLQFPALRSAELRRCAPQIMRRQLADPDLRLRTHAPAATPRARSTRPCPLDRLPARAGRSVLSLSLPTLSFFLIKCSGLADSKRLPWMGTVRILLY